MADAAHEADTTFRPTLDRHLLTTTFPPGSIAHKIEERLYSAIEAHVRPAALSLHLYIRHSAARALRVVLLSWRKLPGPGGEYEPGYVVDKFDYSITALASLQSKRYENESLEYQVVHSLTDEYKDHGDLTIQMLEGIIAAATKVYLSLMALIDAAEGSGRKVHADLGPEPVPDTATYTAVPNKPPSTSFKRKILPAGVETGVSCGEGIEGGDVPVKHQKTAPSVDLEEGTATPKAKKKSAKLPTNQTTLDAFTGTTPPARSPATTTPQKKIKRPGAGNFNHTAHIKWTNEEHHFAEQQIRADPSVAWSVVAARLTDKFKGTAFNAGTKGTIILAGRTEEAVRQRFSAFRAKMKQRQGNNQATQGTDSDVEPEDDDIEYEVGSVEASDDEDEINGTGAYGLLPAREDDEDPLADLEALSRRLDEDEDGDGDTAED